MWCGASVRVAYVNSILQFISAQLTWLHSTSHATPCHATCTPTESFYCSECTPTTLLHNFFLYFFLCVSFKRMKSWKKNQLKGRQWPRRSCCHVHMNIFCAHLRVSYSFLTKLTKLGLVVAPFARTHTTTTTWGAKKLTTVNDDGDNGGSVDADQLILHGALAPLCYFIETSEPVQLKCKSFFFHAYCDVMCIIIFARM